MADWPYNTAAWKRLRKAKLALDPFCEGCKAMGRPYVIANTVDHRHAISDGGNPFPGFDGLASYCPACHSAKTARGTEAGAVRSSKPRRGCDDAGNPLDGAHPWGKNDGADVFESKGDHTFAHKSLKAGAQGPPSTVKIDLPGSGGRNGR